jgi:photosystem II stability/assembly factor-like uncharacterized protein
VRGKWLGSLTVLAALALSPAARANGRYPNADQLIPEPGDESHLVLRATFGILDSRDGGSHWTWICEQAVGYMGDPGLLVLRGGDLLAAYFGAIGISSAGGCSWTTVLLNEDTRFPVDVTVNPGDPSHAWVLTTTVDERQHITLLDVDGTHAIPTTVADGFIPSTLEAAPSRPERIYVMGADAAFKAIVYFSDDTGQSWQSSLIPIYDTLPMYISAVDPRDPDTLYVRADGAASDHLLVSHDRGKTWLDAFTLDAEMLGFALSPDGTRVAVGGPGAGIHVANAADLQFAAAAPVQSVRCLTWTARGLFACAQESLDGWTVALSTNDAQSFTPLWHVKDLVPLECGPTTSTGAACPSPWLDVSSTIGADVAPTDGSAAPAPSNASRSGGSCGLSSGEHGRWLAPFSLTALTLACASRRASRRRRGTTPTPSISCRGRRRRTTRAARAVLPG